MGRAWSEWVKKQLHIDSPVWKILGAVAALITIAGGVAALIVWARGALSDFLTANVEVWHLLVAVSVLGAGGFIVMRLRRPSSPRERATWPREIDLYGVKWPITAVNVGGEVEFEVGKPRCPECRTPLGLDFGEGREPVQLPDGTWKDASSGGMTFRCRKHGVYNLTEYEMGMYLLTRNVEAEAQGKYSTALAAEEQK